MIKHNNTSNSANFTSLPFQLLTLLFSHLLVSRRLKIRRSLKSWRHVHASMHSIGQDANARSRNYSSVWVILTCVYSSSRPVRSSNDDCGTMILIWVMKYRASVGIATPIEDCLMPAKTEECLFLQRDLYTAQWITNSFYV